jgi:hypothetical protein
MTENDVLLALVGTVAAIRFTKVIIAARQKARADSLKALQAALPKEAGK